MGIGTQTSDKVLFIGLHSVYLLGVLWHSGKLFLSAKGKGAFFIASMNKVWYTHLDKLGFVVLDSDLIAHDILIDKPDVAKAFAEYDVFEYGKLSRDSLTLKEEQLIASIIGYHLEFVKNP